MGAFNLVLGEDISGAALRFVLFSWYERLYKLCKHWKWPLRQCSYSVGHCKF